MDNGSVGLALRRHPTHSPEAKCTPEQICPHGSTVWADRKLDVCGTTFVRVQGTDGWLFTSQEGEQTLIRTGPEEEGLFVYRVCSGPGLGVRRKPEVGDECKTQLSFSGDELVAADLRRPSPWPDSRNGPFLRLTDRSGWLFEAKYGKQMMSEMAVEDGLWPFRVTNAPALALRRHPTHRASRHPTHRPHV